jgi:hypothetical protein
MSNAKTKVFNAKYPIASYDESDCHDAAINHLIETGESPTEVEASEHTEFNWHFQDYCEMYWFDMEETVKALCEKYLKSGAGLVCPAFGWTRSAGASREFEANAFNAFKQAYLNTDFSLKVYLKRNHLFGVHLEVVVYHHDGPTGDHMFIVSKKYYEQFIQEHLGRKAA